MSREAPGVQSEKWSPCRVCQRRELNTRNSFQALEWLEGQTGEGWQPRDEQLQEAIVFYPKTR